MARRERGEPRDVQPLSSVSLSEVAARAPRPAHREPVARGPFDAPPDNDAVGLEPPARSGRRRPPPSPLARAVAMLARREHSQAELVRKLMEREVPEAEARAAVARLAEEGLQSDDRFLASKVRQRLNGRYGPGRARVDLARHGLDEEAVNAALAEPGEGWRQGAYDLIERRFGPAPVPFALRTKALGLLLRRGFSMDQAHEVIRTARPDPLDDPPG